MHTMRAAPTGPGKIPFGIRQGIIYPGAANPYVLLMTLFRHVTGICLLMRDGIVNSLLLIRESIKVAYRIPEPVGIISPFRLAGATGGPGIICGGFAPPQKAFSLRVGRPDGGRVTILQKSALLVVMIMAVILFSGLAHADTGDGTPQNSLFVSMHTDQPIDGQITETILEADLSEIMIGPASMDKTAGLQLPEFPQDDEDDGYELLDTFWDFDPLLAITCALRSPTDKCFNQRPKKTKKSKMSGAKTFNVVAKMVGTIEDGGKLVKGEMHDDIPFGPVAKLISYTRIEDGGHLTKGELTDELPFGPIAKCLSLEQEAPDSTKLTWTT